MNKKVRLLILTAVLSLIFVACGDPVAPDLSLSESRLKIDVGEEVTLEATVDSDKEYTVLWSSDDTDVATVSSSGVVKGIGAGQATITATLEKFPEVTATCIVEVSIPVTGVTISKTTLTVYIGTEETLTAQVLPENATNKRINWQSENNDVATVDSNGKITPVSVGTTKIKAVSAADNTKFAECTVTVSQADPEALTASPGEIFIPLGTQKEFAVAATPVYANTNATWEITQQTPDTGYSNVLQKMSEGVFKAVGMGTAKVRATSAVKSSVKSNEITVYVVSEDMKTTIPVSNSEDFKQIYLNPDANFYLTNDIDFNNEVFYGANSYMIIDMAAVADASDPTKAASFTMPADLAMRFVDGNGNPVKHFIDRGTSAYDESNQAENQRLFGPYDPNSSDPLESARYLILNNEGTAYVPIEQHELFLDTSGNLETCGSGAGGILREPYKGYRRVMTSVDNPVGTSGDTRVFHLRGAINPRDIFNEGKLRAYQAPVITFTGVFDGRGYALKNFRMAIPTGTNRPNLGSAQWSITGVGDPWGQSMFGNIGLSGVVRNLVISGVEINLHGQGGIIATINNGTIENILFTNVKSFTDTGDGDGNCGTGFIMGINNPTGIVRNIVFDGTGGTSQIGGARNNQYTVFPMAVVNRAGKAASATQVRNIFIDGTRFQNHTANEDFVGIGSGSNNSYRGDNPPRHTENGGYNPTNADNNCFLITAEEKASIDFSALPSDFWDISGNWPTLKKQTGEVRLVSYGQTMLDGSEGFVADGLPFASNGLNYTFKIRVLKTHTVEDELTVTYSIAGGAQNQTITGTASAPNSDGSIDYIFTIPSVSGNVTFSSVSGVSERSTCTVETSAAPSGVFITDEYGVTVTSLPVAYEGQDYTFGIYLEGAAANVTVKYSVDGGVNDEVIAVGDSDYVSGDYSYWFFTIPGENITGTVVIQINAVE